MISLGTRRVNVNIDWNLSPWNNNNTEKKEIAKSVPLTEVVGLWETYICCLIL